MLFCFLILQMINPSCFTSKKCRPKSKFERFFVFANISVLEIVDTFDRKVQLATVWVCGSCYYSLQVPPQTGPRHFSTIFDNIRHYSTIFDIIRQYSTLFDNIQHYSAIFDNIRLYSTLFDNIRQQSMRFDIFRLSNNVEKCGGQHFLLSNYVADVKESRCPLWGGEDPSIIYIIGL